MLELSTVFRRSTQQVSCNLSDEVAVLHVERGLYFGMQGVGARIWEALEQPRSVADICDDIVAHFDVAPEACREDVIRFLVSLRDAGLIEPVG
ncbi:MAG: PqqD family protein [Reyranella sp.]|jgi:hypothetical protein|nr:PqqD family protein [Reyranella sp.]